MIFYEKDHEKNYESKFLAKKITEIYGDFLNVLSASYQYVDKTGKYCALNEEDENKLNSTPILENSLVTVHIDEKFMDVSTRKFFERRGVSTQNVGCGRSLTPLQAIGKELEIERDFVNGYPQYCGDSQYVLVKYFSTHDNNVLYNIFLKVVYKGL